jgi:hypothetical protein
MGTCRIGPCGMGILACYKNRAAKMAPHIAELNFYNLYNLSINYKVVNIISNNTEINYFTADCRLVRYSN